jgi:S-DNA-T family DNA segregation ATPase FtsK/SpoIIIE
MKSVIGSAKFEAEMELPIALGKTISNETFVVDLAKMPHLLMVCYGQGKSGSECRSYFVAYKKHPLKLKFSSIQKK